MVMGSASTALTVGREFVRQYYTILYEAPHLLHRFYNNESSFVHGGIEKPGEERPAIFGQKNIHEKIIALDFRQCRAKIRQVDCQGIVDGAVVIQVLGELSNNGFPLRRFMQTFVLAPQAANKYFVSNDIFRYEDEVFVDDLQPSDDHTRLSESAKESLQEEDTPHVNGSCGVSEDGNVEHEEMRMWKSGSTDDSQHMQNGVDSSHTDSSFVPEISLEIQPDVIPTVEPPKPMSWASIASKKQDPAAYQKSVRPVNSIEPQLPPQPYERIRKEHLVAEEPVTNGVQELEDFTARPEATAVQQLFVGDIPDGTTEADLREHFGKFGVIQSLEFYKKYKDNSTICFLTCDSEATARHVLYEKEACQFRDSVLTIDVKKPKRELDSGRMGYRWSRSRGAPPRGRGMSARSGGDGRSRGGRGGSRGFDRRS